MKLHRCLIWGLAGVACASIASKVLAAVETTTYPPYQSYPVVVTNSYGTPNYSAATSTMASASNALTVALNAQSLMLKEMVQEHQSRAAELTQKNQGERAKWETELVNELQEKSARVQKNIDQISQYGAESLKTTGAGVDDELVFLSTVEARLTQLSQDLSAAVADSHALGTQMATNRSPDAIFAISLALGDNQRLVKDLQKEQSDLELRKLEFRAIRHALQK